MKKLLPNEFNEDVNLIEDIWLSDNEITKNEAEKAVTAIANLIVNYNLYVGFFNDSLSTLNSGDINSTKQIFYHLRVFLHYHYGNFLINEPNKIIVGKLCDDLIPI